MNIPTVNIVSQVSERLRTMEAIEEDGSQVVSKPLKIVLKKSLQEKQVLRTNLSSDIPPDLIKAISKESEIKEYKNTTRKTWDEFGQSNLVEREPISQNEYRQRKTLVSKVKDFWIEGFLKPSLYANSAINLDWKNSPDAILRPFAGMEDLPVELDESFEKLQTTDILNQTGEGKTLLILGEPGSGKTITLLQLAEKLVNQTEQDLTKPIPVVFNLSSWGQKQQSIEKWLIEEFKDKYQVPQTWSEPWLKQEQLILLLDGLDEVQAEKRDACVRALNQFIATHNITEMVVCSRVKDYEALTERLQLSSALCIKPLSPKQVYSFLTQAGDSLAGVKTLLQQDRELEQFAQTPLILNIMSLAYQDWSIEDLLQQFSSSKDRYRHLFDSYIERMLRRRVINQSEQSTQYPQEKVLHWLSWLATTMVDESKIIFLIEKMQPTLLESRRERRWYRISNFILGGLIVGLIYGL
ncbi:MAG: NACHT domain-containing protein, partial [Waterburya sp.]